MRLFGGPRTVTAAAFPASPIAPPPQIASPWADNSNLDAATFAALFDSLDRVPVTRSQAMSIPAIARGRDLITIPLARFPLTAYNDAGQLAIQPRVCAQPEPGRARFTTMLWTVDTLLFYAASWWLILDRDSDGRPILFRWVPPAAVTLDTNGDISRAFGIKVNPNIDVIRFDGPHEGVLTRGAAAIRDARALAATYRKAANTPVPNVELHQTQGDPLTPEQISDLTGSWAAARRGENGGVAYTNQSIQANFHGQQPADLLIQGREAAAKDCAQQMGLPAWAVDVAVNGSSLTYSNTPSRSRELIDYTLAGYMESIVTRLSLDDILPPGVWAQFSTDVLTDGDFRDRMEAGKVAVDAAIYTAAQIAARERGVPVEVPTQ